MRERQPKKNDTQPGKGVRRARSKLRQMRAVFTPTESERSYERMRRSFPRFPATSTALGYDPWPALDRHLAERDFELRYERESPMGDFSALLDFLTVRGVAGLHVEWVFEALQWHERRAHGPSDERTDPSPLGSLGPAASLELLRDVGRALACKGQGRKGRLTVAMRREIAAQYEALFFKIQALCRYLRKQDGVEASKRRTVSQRDEMAGDLASHFGIDVETCKDVLAEHLDLFGVSRAPRSPTRLTVHFVDRHYGVGNRAIEEAVRAFRKSPRRPRRKSHKI